MSNVDQQKARQLRTANLYKPGDKVSVTHTCVIDGVEMTHDVPVEVVYAVHPLVGTAGTATLYTGIKCDGRPISWSSWVAC